MGTWSISPSGNSNASIDENGVVTFYRNNGSSREFIVKYVDDDGKEAIETVKQEGCGDPALVDLGLPSGTKWAKYNYGGLNYEAASSAFYRYGDIDPFQVTSGDSEYTIVPTEIDLPCDLDSVCAGWGGDWHLPTKDQISELLDAVILGNITYTWETNFEDSGMDGAKFSGNGRYIFIPAQGYYEMNGEPGAPSSSARVVGDGTFAYLLSSTYKSDNESYALAATQDGPYVTYLRFKNGLNTRGVQGNI